MMLLREANARLFATVDPRLRNVILPSGKKVLLSDTVGFISDLPVQLVEAFHATLEEVVEADLLVHVIDSSALSVEDQRSSVLQVLQQIGVPEDKLQNMIEVWNKVDLLREKTGSDEFIDEGEDVDAEEEDEEDVDAEEEGEEDVDAEEDEEDVDAEEEGEEDDLSSEETVHKDPISSELLAGENPECVDDQESEYSEGWEMEDDQQDSWVDVKGKQGMSTENLKVNDQQLPIQPENVQRLEASAVMGIGLQELLHAIDEKLHSQKVVERSSIDCFDRKWRPPRVVDDDAVVQ